MCRFLLSGFSLIELLVALLLLGLLATASGHFLLFSQRQQLLMQQQAIAASVANQLVQLHLLQPLNAAQLNQLAQLGCQAELGWHLGQCAQLATLPQLRLQLVDHQQYLQISWQAGGSDRSLQRRLRYE